MGQFAITTFNLAIQLQQASQAAQNNDSGSLVGWMLAFLMAITIMTVVARPLLFPEAVGRKGLAEKNRLKLESLQDKATAESQSLQDLEFDREMGAIEEKDYLFFKEKSAERLAGLNEEIQLIQRDLVPSEKPLNLNLNGNGAKAKNGQAAQLAKKITGEFSVKSVIKEKLKCGECGTSFKPGSRFCSQCSAPLPLFCLTCGKEITENDRFCSKCGSAVNT